MSKTQYEYDLYIIDKEPIIEDITKYRIPMNFSSDKKKAKAKTNDNKKSCEELRALYGMRHK